MQWSRLRQCYETWRSAHLELHSPSFVICNGGLSVIPCLVHSHCDDRNKDIIMTLRRQGQPDKGVITKDHINYPAKIEHYMLSVK